MRNFRTCILYTGFIRIFVRTDYQLACNKRFLTETPGKCTATNCYLYQLVEIGIVIN